MKVTVCIGSSCHKTIIGIIPEKTENLLGITRVVTHIKGNQVTYGMKRNTRGLAELRHMVEAAEPLME